MLQYLRLGNPFWPQLFLTQRTQLIWPKPQEYRPEEPACLWATWFCTSADQKKLQYIKWRSCVPRPSKTSQTRMWTLQNLTPQSEPWFGLFRSPYQVYQQHQLIYSFLSLSLSHISNFCCRHVQTFWLVFCLFRFEAGVQRLSLAFVDCSTSAKMFLL